MYDLTKHFKGQAYSGMRVGGRHSWRYDGGKWTEVKRTPTLWEIQFDCIKQRARPAPANTGAKINTQYHWFIVADQIATKLDSNRYMTEMRGLKLKAGHKRPHWRYFSYEYPDQASYREQIITFLEEILVKLKSAQELEDQSQIINFFQKI